MQYVTFDILIERELDNGYLAYSPSVPECCSNGNTPEEARNNIRKALEQHLDFLHEQGSLISKQVIMFKFYFSMN